MQENNQTNPTSAAPETTTGPTPETTTIDTTSTVATTVEMNTEVMAATAASDTPEIMSVSTAAPGLSEMSEAPVVVTTEPAAHSVIMDGSNVPAAGMKKQLLAQYGIATLVILIMGTGLVYALEQQGRINTGIFDKISSIVNPTPAAAIVNGEKITKADYEKNLLQLQNAATAQGADAADEAVQSEIKKQAIDVLVNTELLRQEARKDGSDVTPDQVEARYQEIVTSLGGVEALKAKMTELGITEESLRKDIEGEILIQGHLAKAVDTSSVAVSEAEVKAAYEQITATAGPAATIPPLAEIKTQLEAQIKTNKEQELVNAYITKIRETATIEVLI